MAQIKNYIEKLLNIKLVDADAIRGRKFRVCVDAVNYDDCIALAELFRALNVDFLMLQNDKYGIWNRTKKDGFDLGLIVDSQTNSLAIISEDGTMFGEHYTLVAVADYVLSHTPGNTVSSLNCTRALRDVTLKHGGTHFASAVSQAGMIAKMKEVGAVIGGGDNGGIIYPEYGYECNVLVGIVLFLSSLAHKLCTVSQLRSSLPNYHMVKNHIDLAPNINIESVLKRVENRFAHDDSAQISDADGLKIDFPDRWVYLHKLAGQSVINVYSEAKSFEHADNLANQLLQFIYNLQKDILLIRSNTFYEDNCSYRLV
jgi:phosphomannomutase